MVTATACSTVTKFIGYDRWRVHWWKPRLKASPSSATRINVILYHRGGFLCCSLMIYAASHWVVAAGNCLNTGLSKEQAWFNSSGTMAGVKSLSSNRTIHLTSRLDIR